MAPWKFSYITLTPTEKLKSHDCAERIADSLLKHLTGSNGCHGGLLKTPRSNRGGAVDMSEHIRQILTGPELCISIIWYPKGHLLWEMRIKIGQLRIDTILSGPILTDLCR